jgi:hypothetical protein
MQSKIEKMEQENLDQMSDVNEPVVEKYYDPDEYYENERDNNL